jgi:hypothetical protein
LERGIHACSCWRYKRHWWAIDKWRDTSKPALNLLCECSTSVTTSTTTRATPAMSTMLATTTALPGVEAALCHSCKRLLSHMLDGGDLKLCVVGRCVCREHHRRHLLLDSQLIGCQLVDCRGYLRRDSSRPIICGSNGASRRECRCLGGCCCSCIIGCVCVLALLSNTLNILMPPPGAYPSCSVVVRSARDWRRLV